MTKSFDQESVTAVQRGRPALAPAADERRRRLIAAAIRVIGRDGLAAASTRAVAAEAGMNQAMLHYSFASKDALLAAVLDEIHAGIAGLLTTSVGRARSLRGGIERVARAFWAHAAATPELQRVQYELTLYALTTPGHEGLARHQYQGYVTALSTALAGLPAGRGAAPLPVLAGLCVAAMDGLILQLLATGDHAACEAQLQALIAAMQSQCGAVA
ncbi:MAG: TetR family transcriptional regulator [Stagnimonas sp.]|nr:TetR family transcriptional regulator [Stagnimonas sp.]